MVSNGVKNSGPRSGSGWIGPFPNGRTSWLIHGGDPPSRRRSYKVEPPKSSVIGMGGQNFTPLISGLGKKNQVKPIYKAVSKGEISAVKPIYTAISRVK